jgi:hypothetical protein
VASPPVWRPASGTFVLSSCPPLRFLVLGNG